MLTNLLTLDMRPQTISDVIGQDHLTKNGGFIERLVASKVPTSVILYGPPGIIFFDRNGREITAPRIIGFQKAEEFIAAITPLAQ